MRLERRKTQGRGCDNVSLAEVRDEKIGSTGPRDDTKAKRYLSVGVCSVKVRNAVEPNDKG